MENRFIIYSSADDFFIHDKESDRFLDKYEIVAYLIGQDQEITDLEAKLAVADDCADRYWKQLDVEQNYIKQLKQQLAEKEKECEHYKSWFDDDFSHEPVISEMENSEKSQNQTAIAELDKVKDAITYGVEVWTSIDDWGDKIVKYSDLLDFIDQQINDLRSK